MPEAVRQVRAPWGGAFSKGALVPLAALRLSARLARRSAWVCLCGAGWCEIWTRYQWARVLLRLGRGRPAARHAKRALHLLLAHEGPETASRVALFRALRVVLSEALSRMRDQKRGAHHL